MVLALNALFPSSHSRLVYPTLTEDELPQECVVNAGEVLYIPDDWWHSTLNLGQSVFISAFV